MSSLSSNGIEEEWRLISVKLPIPLRKRFKSLCIDRDTTMSEEIGAFVKLYVEHNGNVKIVDAEKPG